MKEELKIKKKLTSEFNLGICYNFILKPMVVVTVST